MDTKVIVDKALKGEDYSKDIEVLADDQKATAYKDVSVALAKAAKDEEVKLVGLRKASKIVEEDNNKKDAAFGEKFAQEQRATAKQRFFSDSKYAMTEAEKAEVEAEFTKRGSDSYNVDNLVAEYRKAYGAVKADSLIDGQQRVKEFEKNAANFNASAAGGSSHISQADADKYSPEAKEMFKELQKAGFKNKTLADAQKLIDKGSDWKKSSLTS